MKTILLILFTGLIFCNAIAQQPLVKDLDGDRKMDTVKLDTEHAVIICLLSSKQYEKIQSLPIEILNEQAGITLTKNGFAFYNNWMRAGYDNQFRYNKKLGKIQLIGMSRYEAGNATNDGSGKSSVNLLTNEYLGDWNYFDEDKQKLIAIPTIVTKMVLPQTFLETFSDKTYFDYGDKCSILYEEHKQKMIDKD